MRIRDVFRQDVETLSDIKRAIPHENGEIHICDLITTPMLVMCCNEIFNDEELTENLTDRQFAKQIYEILIDKLEHGGTVGTTTVSMFGCGNDCNKRGKCCEERKLRIALATGIKNWLYCFCKLDHKQWEEPEPVKTWSQVLTRIFTCKNYN